MLRSMMGNGCKDGTHIPGNGYPKATLVPSLFGREFPYPQLGSWDDTHNLSPQLAAIC